MDAGLAEPEIRIGGGFFVLTIPRNRTWLGSTPGLGHDQVGGALAPGGGQVAGQVTGQVTRQVVGQVDAWIVRVLSACTVRPLSSREIQEAAGLRHRETFQRNYLDQIINDGLVERTVPDKPTSRLQKYRLTEKGRRLLEQAGESGKRP